MNQFGNLRFYVYGLFMPDGTPLYIGKGQGDRARAHLKPRFRHNREFREHLQGLKAQGITPEVHILMDWLTEEQAYTWENYLIGHFGRRDIGTGCLYNKCDGGNGGLSVGYRHGPEQLEKIRKAHVAKLPWVRAKRITTELNSIISRVRRDVAFGERWIRRQEAIREGLLRDAARQKRWEAAQVEAIARKHLEDALAMQRLVLQTKRQALAETLAVKREAERQRRAKFPPVRIRRNGTSWQVKIGDKGAGSRALYCDAMKLVSEIRREQETGIPRVKRKPGDTIRKREPVYRKAREAASERFGKKREAARVRREAKIARVALRQTLQAVDKYCEPSRTFVAGGPHPTAYQTCRFFKRWGWVALTPAGPVQVASVRAGNLVWLAAVQAAWTTVTRQ